MREEQEYAIEDIIVASLQRREYKATGDLSRRLSFHTKMNSNLKLGDVQKVKDIINYIENKYEVKLKIVGGGYGCTKINFKVEGRDEAIELAKKLLKDPEFMALAKDIDLDVIVVPEKNQTLKVHDNYTNNNETESNTKTKWISTDGSTQSVGN